MTVLTPAAKICFAVTITLGIVAIIAVALRFYCRVKLQKLPLGGDDWAIFAALVRPRPTCTPPSRAILISDLDTLDGPSNHSMSSRRANRRRRHYIPADLGPGGIRTKSRQKPIFTQSTRASQSLI